MKLSLVSIEKGFIRAAAEEKMTAEDFLQAGDTNPMEALIGEHWSDNKVLLDMSRVSYVDSSAVGWLINCNKQFRTAGGLLVLHSIPPNVKQVFDLLNIGKILPLVDDESAARQVAMGVANE
jgi:anti-anti-sigma factor